MVLNSDREMPLKSSVSYVDGKTGYLPMSLGKQNTAEMPYELRGRHARRKCDHEDCIGVQKII